MTTIDLATASFGALKRHFATLAAPDSAEMAGTHRGTIIGAPWQRVLARPALVLCRLSGWWGKWFADDARGENLVARGSTLQRRLPMVLEQRPSLVDGRPVLAIVYPPDSYWPWPLIVDELRRVDATTCLGLTVVKPLRLATLAFVIHRHDDV